MESPFFPSPAWNSSFEDHDASTTLDTSFETENDSIIRYEVRDTHHHENKLPTSRSSPGAPFGKEVHDMQGYFDDVESFTSKAIQLHQYEKVRSPPALQQQRYFHQKCSSIDTAVPSEGDAFQGTSPRSTQRGGHLRRGTGFELEVMHESDECMETSISSPAMSTPPIQTIDFVSGRRNSRSHTSQGIPSHSLSCNEDKTCISEPTQTALEKENTKLRGQLEVAKSRLDEVEEQLCQLTMQQQGSENASPHLCPPSPNPMMTFSLSPFQMTSLLPNGATHYIDALGNATPDSTSLSMTPDPFSPFQRFHPHLTTPENTYTAGLGYNSRGVRTAMGGETTRTTASCDSKLNKYDQRVEGGGKANLQDMQIPVELLVAKALGSRSQDASITLQQQLKTGTPARKAAVIQAITPHILRLSDDKHGNFLVQRAVGVHPQVAWKLKNHFVTLSLSQFGCHVVQRILDEKTLRTTVVEELLADQVLETLTCRNSIHVWQKVLEINWTDDEMRKKIFGVVNGVMEGRWAETAMQETGSIICQNIFESADVDEKKDCVSEILERLCECAANQWGVWVVQHIIEHGDNEHRTVAFNQLLSDAVMLTLSQYGQKVIMSALKSRDQHFITQYVDILCDRDGSTSPVPSLIQASGNNSTTSSRRSILVDISSAPQGVQIVTQLLTSVQPCQRDRIIKTVRKNSVFLKGSKAGLRVHQLCERARAFTGY